MFPSGGWARESDHGSWAVKGYTNCPCPYRPPDARACLLDKWVVVKNVSPSLVEELRSQRRPQSIVAPDIPRAVKGSTRPEHNDEMGHMDGFWSSLRTTHARR